MEPASKPFTVGGVISEAFDLYGRNFATLISAALIVFLISGVVQGVLAEGDSLIASLAGSVVALIASTLFTGFVVSLVGETRRGGPRRHSVGELVESASEVIWRLIGAGIIAGIAIVIGLVLLIVPGLFLITIWAVVAPVIVIERSGVIDAFGRSHDLVRGHGWTVFGAILLVLLILLVVAGVAAGIGAGIAGVGGAIAAATVVNILAAPAAALVTSVLYFELRDRSPDAAPTASPAV